MTSPFEVSITLLYTRHSLRPLATRMGTQSLLVSARGITLLPAEIAHDALVDVGATIGAGTKVWGFAQVRENAQIGENCIVGRGAYVGVGVRIGSLCKIQNYALIYEPAELGDGVFIGPGVILTNDVFPRAVNPQWELKRNADWKPVGVVIGDGASIGAGAICVAPVQIGEWAMVAAGSVVTRDVLPYSLVRGAPAQNVGWVGRAGQPLHKVGGHYVCPVTGEHYVEKFGSLSREEGK